MSYQWVEPRSEALHPIVEFRRYRLHPGQRDRLIGLFEEQFIVPQEAVGARILGSFTVEEAPDEFVWLRGFTDMRARQGALERFYGGPVWAAHRDAANATMIDSDDVHLLRAVAPSSGFSPALRARPASAESSGRYLAMLSEVRFPEGIGNYHNWLRLFLRKEGMDPIASFATLMATNNFPALPVWQNRNVHLAVMAFAGRLPMLPRELRAALRQPPEFLVLDPTPHSALH